MRVLPDKLKQHFDNYQVTDLLSAAASCLGITEEGGDNCGPMVELFQSVVSTPQAQPWCVDFIQACVSYVEAITGKQSLLACSQSVVDLWDRSVPSRVQTPRPGDLILWELGTTGKGHCGIITSIDSLTYSTIEGNTNDSAGIIRNGNGVFSKSRAKGGSKTFVELGFLRVYD